MNNGSKSPATDDNGGGDGEDGAALVSMVHDEAAAVPDVEGPDGEGDAVAADGDALGEPLLEPEPRRLLERCRELSHGGPLRHERVHRARRRHGLLGDGAGAGVLLPDPAGEADEDAAVHEPRDDEQHHRRQRHQRQPPQQREPDGVAAGEHGGVHDEVGHLLAQHVLHHEAVVGHAGDHLRRRPLLQVEVLHVLPEHRPKVPCPHPRCLPLRRPRPAIPLCSHTRHPSPAASARRRRSIGMQQFRIELGGEELQGTYHVDLGAELLDDVGATAEVVEDAAGDEQHHRRRDAVAHGAQKPKHHQRHVRRVRVHEHCHERREHRPRLRLAGAAVAASHGRRRRVLSYSLVAI
uniref:Uncharacterized protein n=1 Tax=Oryza rufipogon TaxID=4529 RepID=A0A0E0NB02_ORYRU